MKTAKPASGYSGLFFNGLISLVLLLFFLNYFADFELELTVAVAAISLLAIVVVVLGYRQLLLYALSCIIPLSVPSGIFGTAQISLPAELICVFLSGFFIVKLLLGTRPDPRFLTHPITLFILADLAWIFISSVFSQMPEASFKRFIIRICYYIAFYYFYQELFRQDSRNIKRVLTLHAAAILIPIGYAVVNHARLGFTTVGSQQISAPFYFDHTIYGACLVFFIPFLMHCSFKDAPLREKIVYRLLLAIFTIAVILSYSRAAWLSGIAAMGLGLILKYRVRVKYLAAVAGVLVLVFFVNQQRISSFIKENKEISHSNDISMHFKSISNVNTDASNKERINRWKCALRMFADKPVTGFGPGTYQFFYGQYQQREDLTRISTFNGNKGHAHSEYLNYLSETGLAGCLIFIGLIVCVCVKSIQLIRNKDRELSATALYLFAGLVTFFIHAFFNGFLEFDKMAMPVFASYAAILSLDLNMKEIRPAAENSIPPQ